MYYNNLFEIVFWDVKHGNAMFLRTPNNLCIVQDLGIGDSSGDNNNFSPLKHLRNIWNVSKIDGLIITHPDLDHIHDIGNLDLFQLNCLSCPDTIPKNEIIKKIEKADTIQQKEVFKKYLDLINNCYGKISREKELSKIY